MHDDHYGVTTLLRYCSSWMIMRVSSRKFLMAVALMMLAASSSSSFVVHLLATISTADALLTYSRSTLRSWAGRITTDGSMGLAHGQDKALSIPIILSPPRSFSIPFHSFHPIFFYPLLSFPIPFLLPSPPLFRSQQTRGTLKSQWVHAIPGQAFSGACRAENPVLFSQSTYIICPCGYSTGKLRMHIG